jgi:hypothetical protein
VSEVDIAPLVVLVIFTVNGAGVPGVGRPLVGRRQMLISPISPEGSARLGTLWSAENPEGTFDTSILKTSVFTVWFLKPTLNTVGIFAPPIGTEKSESGRILLVIPVPPPEPRV